MTKRMILTLVVLALAVVSGRAVAACEPQWLTGQQVPGVVGTVYAATTWDPDGPGGQAGVVVVGGSFSVAGGIMAKNIAIWDPTTQTWSALGSGMDDSVVYALAVLGGKVYAGGNFVTAGGVTANGIACWDPASQTWSALGSGITIVSTSAVTAMAVLDDKLYVGGSFVSISGVSASRIACWDPATSAWSALGSGLTANPNALAALDGKLYAGEGSRIACWDPVASAWSTAGTVGGVEFPAVYTLIGMYGLLFVGGDFATVGDVSTNHLAMWDPGSQAWTAIGSAGKPVRALAFMESPVEIKVYALPVAAEGSIGCWDPILSEWTELAAGLAGTTAYSAGSLVVLDQKLYVAGDFTAAGGLKVKGIACWDAPSGNWSVLGSGVDGPAQSVAALDGRLYVGGKFCNIGGVYANKIASWDPGTSSWSTLGLGMDGGSADVFALAALNGKLYAGGAFVTAGGVDVNGIACWDPAASTWSALGTGIDGPWPEVSALATLGEKVYVGGSFVTAGGLSANNIACWDPISSTWSALGAGLTSRVNALAVLNGKLYAGGVFTTAGLPGTCGLACWDPVAQAWSAVGAGLGAQSVYIPPYVRAMAVLNGRLYVAGDFVTAGGVSANRLACWDPTTETWSALGSGSNQDVHALAAMHGRLYAAGWFDSVGGVTADHIAAWSPVTQTWSPLGIGMDECVYSLAASDGALYVGGEFTTAGEGISPYLAVAFADCPEPSIVSAVSRRSHGAAGVFDVNVTAPSAVECRKGGATSIIVGFDKPVRQVSGALADVQVDLGSVISLAVDGATLSIGLSGVVGPQPVTLSFPGIVAHDTGAVVGEGLCFRVLPGDVSGDGMVDPSDVIAIRAHLIQPVNSTNYRSDMTADGVINSFDVVGVRGRYETTATACP